MEKEIISSRQFMIITLLFSIGTTILIIPASLTSEAKQDAWISAIIGVVLSFPVIKLFIAFGNRTPTLTFVAANEKILGRFFGKFTAIGFIIICLLSAGELLYIIGIFMKTSVMPETPTMAFAFLFSIIIIYAAYLGIEVFARSAEILCPIFILIFILFVACISPSIHIENLQPIMETSKKSLFFGMIRFISLFSFPLAVLLTIFPSAVNVQKSAQKGFYIGTIFGGIVLITIITLCILVLGPANTASRTFPSYSLAQRISIGNFLQRIEVIMAAMWIISIYIRTFMYFYAAVIGIRELFKIKNHRPLIFPLGMIILGLSQIVHPNIIHSDIYNRETWPMYSFVFMILLPLVLLLVAKIRKINGNQGNASQCVSSSNNENASQNANNGNSENASQSASSSNNQNASQNASNSNSENASQNASSNCENASQSDSNGNNENASQSASNGNNANASQSGSNGNCENASQSASNGNNENASQSTSNGNNENASQCASNSNNENSSQNASNSNIENASQNASNSNNQNASQNASSNNSENASQCASSNNNENSTQSASSSNNENASLSASTNNNQNASQNTSSNNNQNASQNTSSNNNQNASQNASNSNNQNASQNASNSNNQNASQNTSSNNNENASQCASSNNNQNASQNASSNNSENASQCSSSNNNQNASQNISSNNSENASQSASSSNKENTSQSESISNNENASQSASSNSENATQNDGDTGNIPNSDKNKNSPEN
ncbi:endospore germination permease [Lysinibacillus sp. NPDC094403]|uniref:GerAB/ArcD/ProY family transporter n=1 Tax=Lysinibacillus sp. NPDC094403 TaxID=3390581 RepID=UPI003D068B3B